MSEKCDKNEKKIEELSTFVIQASEWFKNINKHFEKVTMKCQN